MERLPGPVFLSHASEDKPFIDHLETAISDAGFDTWLDSHQLVAGDDLPGAISQALADAGAFVVVISRASLASDWLPYELRLATQRMIHGKLRVIPIRLEKVEMPPEVRSLLYADFTDDFDTGVPFVLKALEQEAAKFAEAQEERYLYLQVERLVREVFDGYAMISQLGEYQSLDYNAAVLEQPGADDLLVPLEVVDSYGPPARPLTAAWLAEFLDADLSQIERFNIVVTRRPVEFASEQIAGGDPAVSVVEDRSPSGRLWSTVFVIDVSDGADRADLAERLATVRAEIEQRLAGDVVVN
jgi:hypothetical protein